MTIFEKVESNDFHMIYILSCGEGVNAYHLIQSTMVQFPDAANVTVVRFPKVRTAEQVDSIVEKANGNNSMIVHTLVVSQLREYLVQKCSEVQVPELDLMGPSLTKIKRFVNHQPLEIPGLYREKHSVNLDQVYAIDYALAQDDGINPDNLIEAEIVLVGLSRAGKTPLSMYLAILGWKVANVPLVIGVDMPDALKKIDRRRIIALNINPEQLLAHRRLRQDSLGAAKIYDYSTKREVEREIVEARKHYIKSGYTMIDVNNKPIETSAEEIIEIVTRRFKSQAHKR